MSVNQGFKSYLIAGLESSWNNPIILSEAEPIVYELVSSSLRNTSDLIIPERFRRVPNPAKGVENFIDVNGDLVFHIHTRNMHLWWKAITQNASPSSSASQDEVLRPAGDWSSTFQLTTQPTDAQCAPALLKFEFSIAKTGYIDIVGVDQNDIKINERVSFSNASSKTSVKQYKTVTSLSTNITRSGSETLTVKGNKNVTTYTYAPSDDVSVSFTAELVKGSYPSVYTGCVVNTATIRLADIMTLTLGIIASRGYNFYKLSTSSGNRTPVPSESPSPLTGFSRVTEGVMPRWTTACMIDFGAGKVLVPVADVTITLNNQLRFPERFTGSRYRNVKPIRGAVKDYLLTLRLDYTKDYSFVERFLTLEETSIDIIFRRMGIGEADRFVKFEFPKCQLRNYPDVEVDNFAELMQELEFVPLRQSLTTPDEYTLTVQD